MRQLRRRAGSGQRRALADRAVRGRREIAGIWRFADLYTPFVPPEARLTLGEGGTPAIELPAVAAEVGLERLVLKREDHNPTGSHKARGAAFQVSALRWLRPGLAWLAISSSGNAALAAAAYAREGGLNLAAFVAPGTPEAKLRRLADLGARVLVSDQALSLAQGFAETHAIPNLRPSTDPLAVEGFQSIAWELVEDAPPVDALFTFVSSGTSFVALGRAFARAGEVTADPWQPALHAVQGTGAQPIAGEFDPRSLPETRSELGGRGARKTRRVGEAKRWIRASGGSAWVITDAEAEAASALLTRHGVATSLEGAAALAAAVRAAAAGLVRSAVVLLTGTAAEVPPDEPHGEASSAPPHAKPSALTGATSGMAADLWQARIAFVSNLVEVEAVVFGEAAAVGSVAQGVGANNFSPLPPGSRLPPIEEYK